MPATPDSVDFFDIQAPAPTLDYVAAEYARIESALDAAKSAGELLAAVRSWDQLRRRLDTWNNLTHLHFNQDTRNPEYKRALEYRDELQPKLTELAVRVKRRLLQDPRRPELERHFGAQAFAIWEADVLAYDPVIEAEIVQESKLESQYTELLAAAEFEYRGEKLNLSGLAKFREHADRRVREETERLRWAWFAANTPRLDGIYDQLVKLRTSMARKLGFENYIGLAYKRMKRIDYNQQDVERYRAAVREFLVPVGIELRRRQAAALGVSPLMYWDEAIHDPAGNPAPLGDHDWMLERAREMFDAMGGGLGEYFRLMCRSHLMDLKNRDGKAGGGFCTDFPSCGLQYIFANFNGTKSDVEVFTHEMGHAFQGYMSRTQPLVDYFFPTNESCEIHSMSLEFLTGPHMERFFGDGAERFRRIHLAQSLLFVPYGVAVDHFQHLVYARPEATPTERHAMWREMERLYLPWRNYGDLPHVADGGMWQLQRHIYIHPFYYIDYTLAQTCAWQFWLRGEQNFAEAMDSYVALCRRGGEAPFQQLAASAGLQSPFEDGSLQAVVSHARGVLGLA